jgi:hypothetical protein
MSAGKGVAQRVAKLRGQIEQLARRQVAALVLELPEAPAGTEALPDGRCVLLGLGDVASRQAVLEALQAGAPMPDGTLLLEYRATASRFIAEACGLVPSDASELLATSPRGEGKSQAALGAMLAHAILHGRSGHPWPVRWQVVGSSRVYLNDTVGVSLAMPWWRGCWAMVDGDRLARLTVDGAVLVEAPLVGVEDEPGIDRLRREVHCAWTDEPAAAMGDGVAGITRVAWGTAVSSSRMPTHRTVALLTSNAPSPRAWVWRRFITAPEPGCKAFRIPKGERSTQAYRDMIARQLADSPDLFQRLGEGEAALPLRGLAVAKGYRESECVAPAPLQPIEGAVFYVGVDAGLSPAAVICQARDGRCWVYSSATIPRGGTAELVEDFLRPWFVEHAPGALTRRGGLIFACDPNMRTPSQHRLSDSPEQTLAKLMRGHIRLGPVRWAPRRDALVQCFTPGRSRLWISPIEANEELRLSLGGGFHYRATGGGEVTGLEPVKDDASHVADALIYVLCELWPQIDRQARRDRSGPRAEAIGVNFSPLTWGREPSGGRGY